LSPRSRPASVCQGREQQPPDNTDDEYGAEHRDDRETEPAILSGRAAAGLRNFRILKAHRATVHALRTGKESGLSGRAGRRLSDRIS